MNLQEVFDQLSSGELSQLSLAGPNGGPLQQGSWPGVINSVNLGLTALYKRFNLKQDSKALTLNAALENYPVGQRDVLKLLRVQTDAGFDVPLNDALDDYSCFTPSPRVLRVPQVLRVPTSETPEEYRTTSLLVTYQANHPWLDPELSAPEMVELELPDTHLQALLYFVASRAYNPIGMGQEFNAGNTWFAKYEAECRSLENEGMQADRMVGADRLRRGGWV